MRFVKWMAILLALGCVGACFLPWITIPSKELTITGMDARAIGFGYPALLHFFFSGIYLVFMLLNRNWSLRTAFFIQAFNVAWAIRNYIGISACYGGECPQKQIGLYCVLFFSIACLAIFLLFRDKK